MQVLGSMNCERRQYGDNELVQLLLKAMADPKALAGTQQTGCVITVSTIVITGVVLVAIATVVFFS